MYQTKRSEVMEKGVTIEAGISGILGFILNIEPDKSKSLGYQNSALSFQSKVNLLTDLKFVPKEIATQFQIFAEIRNKFAHVLYVDNFSKCFELIPERKKYILQTFVKDPPEGIDEEGHLYLAFTFLCFTLGFWMNLILERSHYQKIQDVKKTTVIEMLRSYRVNNIEENPEEKEKFNRQVDELLADIQQDPDFISSVNQAIKIGENNSLEENREQKAE